MSMPSFGVIVTKIKNFVTRATLSQKIASLKSVIETDLDRAVETAHETYDREMPAVVQYAKRELAVVEGMVQAAARRAETLITHDILHLDETTRAQAVITAGAAHTAANSTAA